MKKQVLLFILCLVATNVLAQNDNRAPRKSTKGKDHRIRPNKCPRLYGTLSTGLNNNTGPIGVSIDISIEKNLAVELGGGISTWGNKFHLGGKYFTDPCHRGWAFGTGITHNTGNKGYSKNMNTINGNEPVQLNLHDQTNVLFTAYRYWSIGKQYNKVYTMIGWSLSLNNSIKYEQTSGDKITDDEKKELLKLTPGGLIIGAGITLAIF